MRAGIHPKYEDVTINCSCGNTFVTRSTVSKDIRLEVCSECHPFYTGQQKIVDTAGRVDRFKQRYGNMKNDSAQNQTSAQEDKE